MATIKRKRVSKKNKISWRKNVDITDVENFLEDQRLEERLGSSVSQKVDGELFSIDTTGADDSKEPLKPAQIKVSSVRKSLRIKESATPTCFALLDKRSAVSDPVIKRNRVNIPEKTRKFQKNSKPVPLKNNPKERPEPVFRDIWAEKDTTRELNGLSEWLTPDTIRNVLHGTGHKKSRIPKSIQVKPSPHSAVENPHPGTSYNPSLADHRDLLHQVATVEAEEEKREEHIHRVTTKMFKKVPIEEAERNWMNEMSGGINLSSGDESGSDDGGDFKAINPPALRKKKTLKKRRKIREERERKQAAAEKKVEKRKRSDVNEALPKLKKSIEKKEKVNLASLKKRKEKLKLKVLETKQLSKVKFDAPLQEFQIPQDLRGSLRKMKPEGSILQDRYMSLQRRNVLEPTLKRHKRLTKVKKFVKGSHKMGWEPKGY